MVQAILTDNPSTISVQKNNNRNNKHKHKTKQQRKICVHAVVVDGVDRKNFSPSHRRTQHGCFPSTSLHRHLCSKKMRKKKMFNPNKLHVFFRSLDVIRWCGCIGGKRGENKSE